MASPSRDMKYVWFLVEGRLPRAGEALLSPSILFAVLDLVLSDSYCMSVPRPAFLHSIPHILCCLCGSCPLHSTSFPQTAVLTWTV